MQIEGQHAQSRRVHELEVHTPLIVPSFSSRGFPELSHIWEEFRHKLYGVCLVSAFDIAGGRIPADAANMVNVIVLDSGVSETKGVSVVSGDKLTHSSPARWTRKHYHEAVGSISEGGNVILVNFDQVGRLEDQIESASEDFSHASHTVSDFLVKPPEQTALVNVPRLSRHREALSQFSIIGITALEAGNSFLRRCSSLVMLRNLLNEAGLDTPIHVFGAISPYEVLAYFFCGADIFDGLNWLRLAFRRHASMPIAESATEDMKWKLTDLDLRVEEWTRNLRLLYRLQESLQRYATNGDIDSLTKDFPIAQQSVRIAEIAGAEIWK